MADKKKIVIYAELDGDIPLHREAMDFLQEYQKKTGLSKKDALVQILAEAKKKEAAISNKDTKRQMQLMGGTY